MRVLEGLERERALSHLRECVELAKKSCCLRSKCGSIIVSGGNVLGRGYNSPPGDNPVQECFKDSLPKDFKSDRTCCVHAEQRAVMDALRNNPEKIAGSRIYFIRINDEGEMLEAGDPYCTICSKMVLDAGVKEFVLLRREGVCVYDTTEYNNLSFGL